MSGSTVFLIRHGAHDLLGKVLCGGDHPIGLNAEGRDQAIAVGRRLVRLDVRQVVSSPAARTRETAEVIADQLGVSAALEADLGEIGFGDWVERGFEDLAADPLWSRWNTDRARAAPPGGESGADLAARVARWLDRVRGSGSALAAVSHADVIKAAVCHVLGLGLQFHNRFEIAPGSITTLALGDWGMKVMSLNEAPA